ncbi:MAG: glycosyltransferase family 4 protein [Spirochaetes bacterium]|nr:glycosyltransferase family 4 protein [Spirochaetota bacterium]
MNILFVHPSGAFGGASKSLFELYKTLSKESINGSVICPFGNVRAFFFEAGLDVYQIRGLSQWDNTRYGYYRGFRWLILLRELFLLPGTWFALRKILRSSNFDIVHLNEATLLPWARIIRRYTRAPIILHVRSLQRGIVNDKRTRRFNESLVRDVDKIIAIDETVRRTLPSRINVKVIHNGISVNTTKIKDHHEVLRVGIVGGLLKLKGVYEFIEAARILINDRKINIEFFIVGENPHSLTGLKGILLKRLNMAHDVRKDIEAFVRDNELEDKIHLSGFVKNVNEVYEKLDLLCFPSHLDAAGRPVFEAAFHGVPSIVAVRNPPPDTIVNGETGICIDHSDSTLLANAIEKLHLDRSELLRLGENARCLALANFDINKNALKVLGIYQNLLDEKSQLLNNNVDR